jgi:hypothetical protein
MVSTSTPNGGMSHKKTLIFQENIASRTHEQSKVAAMSSMGKTMEKLILLFTASLFFVLMSAQLSAQCVATCINHSQIAIDEDGVTQLTPAMFFDGDPSACNTLSINPSSIDCNDVGNNVIVTLTVTSPGGTTTTCQDTFLVVETMAPEITCPADLTINCEDSTDPSNTGSATATDNCTTVNNISITYSDAIVGSGDCYVLERTWEATDDEGNSSTCLQTITVVDNQAPQLFWIPNPPADATISCSASLPSAPTPGITDNCDNTLSVSVTEVGRDPDPATCEHYNYEEHRTWTVTDDCGNSDSYTQVFTRQDVVDPVIAYMGPTHHNINTVTNCEGSLSLDLTGTESDNCASSAYLIKYYLVIDLNTGDTVKIGNGLDASDMYYEGQYRFEFTVVDPCGNMDMNVHTVDVLDLDPPTAKCKDGSITVNAATGMTTLTADMVNDGSFDNCTPTNMLQYSLDPATIPCDSIGMTVEVELTVTDASGNSNTCIGDLDILASPPSPICDTITVELDGMGGYTLDMNDLDNLGNMFIDMCTTTPLTFASSQMDFDCGDIGENFVTLTGTNSFGKSSSCQALVRVEDNVAPTPVCAASFEASLPKSGTFPLQGGWLLGGSEYIILMSSGNNGSGNGGWTDFSVEVTNNTTLSFDWAYESDDTNQSRDRFGYRINGGGINWITSGSSTSQMGSESIGLSAGDTFTFRVRTSDNQGGRAEVIISNLPSFTGDYYFPNWEASTTNSDGKAFISGDAILSIDNCTSPFDINLTTSPAALDCDDIASRTVTVTATDAYNNSAQCSLSVDVVDEVAPMFTCADFTAQLLSGFYFPNTDVIVEPAWFLADPTSLYMESGSVGGSPANIDYRLKVKTATTVTFDWSFASSDANNHERFGYVLGNTFYQLSNGSQAGGTESVIVASGQYFGFRIVSDHDANTSEANITNLSRTNHNGAFFRGDFDPVRWERIPAPIPSGRAFIYGDVMDNCSSIGELDITMSVNNGPFVYEEDFTCFQANFIGTFDITVRIEDAYGNVETCDAVLTVVDNEPPVAVCPPNFSATLNQDGYYFPLNPATFQFIINGSYDNCIIDDIYVTPDTLDCSNIGPNTVVYHIVDGAGNETTCSTEINIQETTPPSIICPIDITVQCEDLPADTMPSNSGFAVGTDNCGSVTITHSDAIINQVGPNCYEIERTWAAEDDSGNTNSCVQYITVEDNIAPTLNITNAQSNYTAECQADPVVMPTFSDNCGATMTYDTTDSRINYPQGTFNVNPSQSGYYNYSILRNWFVTDGCGQSVGHSQFIVVEDTQAPVFNHPAMVMVNNDPGQCGAQVTLSIDANEISDCADYQYLTFSNDSGRGNDEEDASGFYNVGTTTVTFTAEDPSGNISSIMVDVVVKDVETPTINCVAPNIVDVYLNSNGVGILPVSEVNKGSIDNCGIVQINLTPNTFGCADLGPQNVTLTVTDAAGNNNTCTTTVNVLSGGSIAINCPADITINCPTLPDPSVTGMPTFTSTCGGASVTHNDVVLSGNGTDCGVIERTWTITNGLDTESCVQLITIEDNNAPSLPAPPPSGVVSCDNIPASVDLTANDVCAGIFQVSPTEQEIGRSGNPFDPSYYNYVILRTWTATDNCGNSSTRTQSLSVQDNVAPAITFPAPLVIPTDINACETFLNVDVLDYISDNCAANQYLSVLVDGVANSIISGVYVAGTYNFNVEVSDPTGNTSMATLTIKVEDQQTPDAECIQNVVITLDNTGNANISPADIDAGSSDNCTPTNLLLMSVNPATFTTADIGAIQITLTVEDEEGNVNTCVSNATVVGGTVLKAANVAAPELSMEDIPVTVENFQDVTSFEFDVDVQDIGIAEVDDLINVNAALDASGIFTFTANANGYFVQWIDTSGTPGLSFADGTSLFDLKVNITGSNGDVTPVLITNNEVSKLIGGVPTVTTSSVMDGSVTVLSGALLFDLSGAIATETNVPAENVTVNLTGSTSGSQLTGAPGTFSYTVPTGSNSIITPSKNTGWSNGVTTADAFYVLQHVAGSRLFGSPYVQIAADANDDNVITTFDAFNILQLALGNIPSIAGNTSWRFVPASPALPPNPFGASFDEFIQVNPVNMNMSNLDFVAIKTGDVDSTANPAMKPLPGDDRTSGIFEFTVQDVMVRGAGELIAIPVKARNFNSVNTFQFTFDFDETALEFVEMVPANLPNLTAGNFNTSLVEKGKLATGWMHLDAQDVTDGTELFILYFRTLISNVQLSNTLTSNASMVPMEVLLSGDRKLHQVDLVFESTTDTYQPGTFAFELKQNIPNPFRGETIIGFILPDAGDATLSITDASGKLVYQVDGQYVQGYNEVRIAKNDLPGSGVFMYRLDTDKQSSVRKMVLFE